MKRYELEEMTRAELIEHAKVQGIEVDPEDKKGTMVDKILGEFKGEAKPAPKRDDRALPALGRLHTLSGELVNAPKYRVTIFATPDDKSDVDLICNGHNVRIKRGVEVVLMEPYVEILRNAVIDTVVQDPETGVRVAQRMMVYPHQAVPV